MTQNIDRAVRDLFEGGRSTRNIKYYVQPGRYTADQLADYRLRVHAQIREGLSVENHELDSGILD
ncbi:MAG: hypothetical protein AAF559_12165 [Pseudomonadota bacterium]